MALRVIAIAVTLSVLLSVAGGCADRTADNADATVSVTINDHAFQLDVAADEQTRMRGLGGRASIPEDGGMIFIFPEPGYLSFHMKDCLVDIDIIFIDAHGRITAMHEMAAEPLRGDDESEQQYLDRLPNYRSRMRAQYAIELRSGWLDQLDLAVEDKIELDTERLKALSR